MIALKIEEYCHNCPDFEPSVNKETFSNYDIDFCKTRYRTNTLITCERRDRCKSHMEYLSEQKCEKKD